MANVDLRSPLRYPGGKSRAVKLLLPYIPQSESRIMSPFIGGASLELALVRRGHSVRGYDAFSPLVNFWQQALADAAEVARRVRESFTVPMARDVFYQLQNRIRHWIRQGISDPILQAASYFAINRSSFSGATLSGGMSPGTPRFTDSAINRLAAFRVPDNRFAVDSADFRHSIPAHKDDFLYLDPPYALAQPNLYGDKGSHHDGFDHYALAELLTARDRWALSYNDCPLVRQLYSNCRIENLHWQYGMAKHGRSSEVVITPA